MNSFAIMVVAYTLIMYSTHYNIHHGCNSCSMRLVDCTTRRVHGKYTDYKTGMDFNISPGLGSLYAAKELKGHHMTFIPAN